MTALLTRWNGASTTATLTASEPSAISFDTATPDEVFDFIDNELGLS